MIQFQSRKINCSASKDLSVTDENAKVKNSEKKLVKRIQLSINKRKKTTFFEFSFQENWYFFFDNFSLFSVKIMPAKGFIGI